jgi:Na+-translocating ferredoxin:NAD+ oxidoreductase subunit E
MSGTANRFDSTIRLLALCPLLAASDTVINALGLSVAVLLIVPLASATMLILRRWLIEDSVFAVSALILATIVACAELLMRAWFPDLRTSLGLFLPLIVANLVILDHLQESQPDAAMSLSTGLRIALGIAASLLILGFAREFVGRGSLLHSTGRMLGTWASELETTVFHVDMGFLLAMLPPGAFIALGLLIATRNWLAPSRS